MNRSLPCRLLLVLALIATCTDADARNTRYLFPADEVVRSASARQLIGKDVSFHFGDATPRGLLASPEAIDEVSVRAVATPTQFRGQRYSEEESDKRTCREALRMALSDLAQRARDKGGNAVVRIVSFYNRVEMSSATEYECHAGMTRSVVELKGRVARIDAAVASAGQTVPAGQKRSLPLAEASRVHSNAGEIVDFSLLPDANEQMIERYKFFLTRSLPRAFAISVSGDGWWASSGYVKDDPLGPEDRALRNCERKTGTRCFLYAVDDAVVYKPTKSYEKISDAGLLPNASEKMVARYKYFLTRPLPRAFAISDAGEWWMSWGKIKGNAESPAERALRDCEKNYAKHCVLYAVDDAVVYNSSAK